jgi:hypothetical protein
MAGPLLVHMAGPLTGSPAETVIVVLVRVFPAM